MTNPTEVGRMTLHASADGTVTAVWWDTGGNLYRQYNNGTGTFGARTLIAKGWSAYKALS